MGGITHSCCFLCSYMLYHKVYKVATENCRRPFGPEISFIRRDLLYLVLWRHSETFGISLYLGQHE